MKTNLCSAGSSYIHAYPNGDIYRCMKDYNTKMKPISNVLTAAASQLKLFDKPKPCSQRLCDVYCDADWSTKWLFDENKIPQKIPANEWDGCTYKHPWSEMELEHSSNPHFMAVIWTPTLPCNYTCTYCGCAAGNKKIFKEFPSSTPELDVKQWLSFYENLVSLYDWGYLQTNGGEPLLSNSTIPVLQLLSPRWAVNLVTNASVKIMELVRCQMPAYNEERDYGLSVTLSLHPTSKQFSWDTFLGKALMLKNEGYLRGVNFVGWPEQLYLFEYYKEQLDKFGITLALQPWAGTDNNGFFGYTEKEMEFVRNNSTLSRVNNFLDLTEYRSSSEFQSKLNLESANVIENQLTIKVLVENEGTALWDSENIKVGARILPSMFSNNKSIKEYRAPLPKVIATGDKFHATILVDLDEPIDEIKIILDLVYEQKFWFSERGSEDVSLSLLKKNSGWFCREISKINQFIDLRQI